MEPLLEVRNLSVRYHTGTGAEVFALTGADLHIEPGETVGVLGESGSGKSTLAAALLAMLPPNAAIVGGAALLRGANLLNLDAGGLQRLRGKHISLIYQEPSAALHPTMRVGTQVEEVLRAHTKKSADEIRREVRNLLESLFAADADRIRVSYPHQLSGGQRQRIAIAQTIVCKPDLLIADEPTASLDPVTQHEILDLLKGMQRKGNLAILFITHSVELLYGFASRVVVLYAGRIVEEGGTRDVLDSPQHPYTQALLKCRPTLAESARGRSHARFQIISGDPPDLSVNDPLCAFEPRCPDRMHACRERPPELSTAGNGTRARCLKFGS
jgi:oligopeptide/dipeptide ABC transporter ATP-binding protein